MEDKLDSTNTHRTIVTTISDSAGVHKVKTDTIIKQTSETIVIKKDINVDWITPVTKLISDFTWPIVVVIVLVLFRKQVALLISRIKEVTITTGSLILKASEDKTDNVGLRLTESVETGDDKKRLLQERKMLLKDRMINKILTTFWKYQKENKSNNHLNRWTFTLLATNNDYRDFIEAIDKLHKASLVEQNIQSQQFYLTNEGIALCEVSEIELNSDVFKF
jgi:hypothetical protein